ncbi:MAG: GTPase HflX [Planctomycetes bacterium]|nr:GTPase HflX [Planctomycetota bacterium]
METDQRTHLSVVQERAILVGVALRGSGHDAAESLLELAALAESAGATIVHSVRQKRETIDPKFYIGKGKVDELADRVKSGKADVVIFDDDLSPAQLREIEEACGCKVIDRSELILDIFASRARTNESRLQVELAQLEYTAPRLRGMWTHLERIAGAGGGTGAGTVGGIGTRGPGERQIEIDRRIVSRRVTWLKRQIAQIDRRKIRQVRARHEHFNVSLVGYTNAGKSTLMNTLTDAGVRAEDRLFATLDTKTARWNLGDGLHALLSDTVGFLRRLPHHLVASFRATLEEAIHADLLLHVVDASSPAAWEQYQAVTQVLNDLGCGEHDTIVLLNKMDLVEDRSAMQMVQRRLPDAMAISARTGVGISNLVEAVRKLVSGPPRQVTLHTRTHDGKAISAIEKHAQVLERRYLDGAVDMDVVIGSRILKRLQVMHPHVRATEPER